jgi:hypothetical protein
VFLLEADCLILRSNTIENIVFSQNSNTGFLPGLALKITYLSINTANGLTLQRHLLSVCRFAARFTNIAGRRSHSAGVSKEMLCAASHEAYETTGQGDAPSFSFDKKAVRESETKSTGWICVPLGACDGHWG